MSDREKREAFVTLATNDTYSLGCLVLGCSLRRVNTSRQLVVMVTTDVSNPMRSQLAQVYDHIQEVDLLDSKDPKNLTLLGRPDLNVTFTKLHCWRLTQYDKAVFLDADTLVLQNVDELFDREELSAAPDAGWPDCFNSGVFVFKPSEETYESLLNFAMSRGSFDGGDQGLLNLYFSNWSTDDISKHLPFIYNVVSQAFYSYLPAFTQFKDRVRIVHFIGATKPWHQPYNTSTRSVQPLPGSGHSQEFLQVWWNIFMEMVQPSLDPNLRAQLQRKYAPPTNTPPIEKSEPSQDTKHPGPTVRESMEETISTVYPFVPPKLDEVFYDADKHSKDTLEEGSIKEESKVIEVPVYRRAYTALEANYPEEPISNINPEHPPYSIYEATKAVEGWEKGRRDHDSGYTSRNGSHSEVELKESSDVVRETIEKVKAESESLSRSDVSHKEEPGHETKKDENKSSSEAGLAGELAHLSVEYHSPAVLLSDKERKLNWEKGQIDYLGQDAFDNIQKKLDETLNKEEAPAPPPSISSPFTPKEVAPAKTVAAPEPKTMVVAEAKRVAAPKPSEPAPKEAVAPAPKVASTPAPPAQKPTVAPVPKATVAPTPKPTMAAPKTAAAPAPAPAPASKVAAPAPTAPAPTAKATVAAPIQKTTSGTQTTAKTATPAPKATASAPKVAPAPAPAPAPKVAAAAPKTAEAPKAAPAPAPKATASAPKVTAPAPAPAPAPKVAAAAPKTAEAPKATGAAAPPPQAAGPADTKTAATAPKPTGTADAKTAQAPPSKVSSLTSKFGAKK